MSAHLSNQAGGNLAAVDAGLSRPKRRVVLRQGLAAALALASPGVAQAALALRSGKPAEIAFYNTHTSERLELVYRDANGYLPDAMAAVAHILRDHRNNEIKPIDPALLDQLHLIGSKLDTAQPFHVISGYRSPETNAKLAAASNGVARHSMHLEGRAIDIRLPGRPLAELHRTALALRAGGVGMYPASDFVHIDTGRVRTW